MTLAPDQNTAAADATLLCPLCTYDLRATTDPRCPECGYAFDWDELRDPARRLHPYAFEHHPERNVTSFFQTFFAGLRPKRFWRTLFPTQPSQPRRLIVYWLVAALASLVPLIVEATRTWPAIENDMLATRNRVIAGTAMPGGADEAARLGFPTTQAYVDAHFPVPTAAWIAPRLMDYHRTLKALALVALLFILWPWVTFVGLMVFQISMRRARIQPRHVLRCVLYTSDAALWLSAVPLGMIAWQLSKTGWATSLAWGGDGLTTVALWTALAGFVLYTWRLASSYRHYLRFPHALPTALAVQLMVALLFAFFVSEWYLIRF